MANSKDRYLLKRKGQWYYSRRTPLRFRHLETREYVRTSLQTRSLEIARMRRDGMEVADNDLWQSLVLDADGTGQISDARRAIEHKRHKSAVARAMAVGFIYKQTQDIVDRVETSEILQRLAALEQRTGKNSVAPEVLADALLGAIQPPNEKSVTVSQTFDIYLKEIVFSELFNKSKEQRRAWTKTKQTSIDYFINVIGDMKISDIERSHALKYKKWWMERMSLSDKNKNPVKPNTANRHVGNIRQLYQEYYTHIGKEERQNPFRNIYFKGDVRSRVQSFGDEWVQQKILVPGLFDTLNPELRGLVYVLIETGARMSEIVNLTPSDIRLDEPIPYISIKPRERRQLKTPNSERDIPLIGVALEAMQSLPSGFPKYRDKGALVSANLMKAFKGRKLFPTKDHVIYSFRHSFEKRMQEANIDYGLRCLLMGHKNDRPSYGDGGSMEYRRNELLKIVHPYSADLFS